MSSTDEARRERIGWPLLPLPDENGELHFPSLERSVRESIEILLRTRPGAQLMHPSFGGGLEEFLHEPNELTTRRRIRQRVLESLERWERRIAVERIEVWEVEDAPAEVRVEIAYRILRSGRAVELNLSMDLAS